MAQCVRGLCLAVVVPLLIACAVPASLLDSFGENAVPDVSESANAYNQDVRWGRIQQAVAQIVPERREKFLELFDAEPGSFHFTSVEVMTAIPTSIDGREVDVLVAWEFYSPPALTERKLRQKQKWRYRDLERRWEVEPDFTIFDAELARVSGAPVPAAPQR